MTPRFNGYRLVLLHEQIDNLRTTLALTAAAVADTSDKVAATHEHAARGRPGEAARLREMASAARRRAATEREHASRLRPG